MAEQTIRLIYPPSLVNAPVINQLIRNYELTVNIVGAQVSGDSGWIDLRLNGNDSIIEDAIQWLKSQGIQVDPLPE